MIMMSLDVDTDILEEEYFEDLENKLDVKVMNSLRTDCDEVELICKEESIGV